MNIHTNKTNNGAVEAIWHIPCPSGSNLVGVPWCDCVLNCGDYAVSESKALQKDDLPKIRTGEIIEKCEMFHFSKPNLSNAEKEAELEERYNKVKAKVQAEILLKLRYYGFEEDV